MKKIFLALFIIFVFCGIVEATPTCTLLGAPCALGDHNCDACTSSCEYNDVQAAVYATARDGTVTVEAGACTWTERLWIDRAMKIYGAGISETEGTRLTFANGTSFTPTSDWNEECAINYGEGLPASQIIYKTRDAQADEHVIFEFKGFVIYQPETTNKVGFILVQNGNVEYPLRSIMIHDNLIKFRTNWDDLYQYNQVISTTGNVFGVFYNNTIYTRKPYINMSLGRIDDGVKNSRCEYTADDYNWINNKSFKPGSQDVFVLEDNTWHFYMTTNVHMGGSYNGQLGFVIRYNTYHNHDTSGKGQGGHDAHGAYVSLAPPFGAEVYGNYFKGESVCTVGNTLPECYRAGDYYVYGVTMLHTRAGRNMVFNNLAQNFGGNKTLAGAQVTIIRACDECTTRFNVNSQHACTNAGFSECNGKNRCAYDGQPFYVADTYVWQNRYGEAGTTLASYVARHGETDAPCACETYDPEDPTKCINYDRCSDSDSLLPQEEREWWRDNSRCTSSECLDGIGCGAAKPTGNCDVGTAYWVTDQDCTTLTTANVGATTDGNFADKVRSGALYRCEPGSPPKWSDLPYYVPLKYPHPLREEPSEPPSEDYNAKLLTDSNVISLYKFEGTAGLTVDSKGANALVASTNSPTADSSDKAEGSYSSSFTAASSQYFSIPISNISSTFPGIGTNKTFTIAGWFKAASLPTDGNAMVITAMSNSEETDWVHAVILKTSGSNTNLKFILGTHYVAQSQEYTHLTNLNTTDWFHFTASFDGSSAYAIRLRDATGATVGTDVESTYDGESDTATTYTSGMLFDGLLDELVFFNRAISSDDAGNIAAGDYIEESPTDTDAPKPSDPCAGYTTCRRPIIEVACEEADEVVDLYIGLLSDKAATCKWDTSVDGSPVYAELTNTFDGTGTQVHTDTATGVSCNATTRFYYACEGTNEVASDVGYFDVKVADYNDVDAPVLTNLTLSQRWNVTNKITVTTDKASTCYWCLDDSGVTCDTDTDYTSMTQMVNSEGNTKHIAFPTQEADTTETYNVKCKSTQGVESSALQISLTTKPALGIDTTTGNLGINFGTGKLGANFK